MCTRVLQDEVAKRQALEDNLWLLADKLRPLAAAVYVSRLRRSPLMSQYVAEVAETLIDDLRFRPCCITLPAERHTKACSG